MFKDHEVEARIMEGAAAALSAETLPVAVPQREALCTPETPTPAASFLPALRRSSSNLASKQAVPVRDSLSKVNSLARVAQIGIGSCSRDSVVSLPPLGAVPEEPPQMPGQCQPTLQQLRGQSNSLLVRQVQPDAAVSVTNVQGALEGRAPVNAPLSSQQTVTVSSILSLAFRLFLCTCLRQTFFFGSICHHIYTLAVSTCGGFTACPWRITTCVCESSLQAVLHVRLLTE
jgi:hypothetical protein